MSTQGKPCDWVTVNKLELSVVDLVGDTHSEQPREAAASAQTPPLPVRRPEWKLLLLKEQRGKELTELCSTGM